MPANSRDLLPPLTRRTFRPQHTIGRSVQCRGVGFLTGADVTLTLHPSEADSGLSFQRLDCPGTSPVPATRDHVLPRQRRTAIGRDGVVIELVEHVVAALAGLQVDNCRITLDAPEPPGFDGSCQPIVEELLAAGVVDQDRPRMCLMIDRIFKVGCGERDLTIRPLASPGLAVTYHLDYGCQSPIKPQNRTFCLSPERFVRDIASCRTFILDSEVASLQAQGFGRGLTHRDLLVFGSEGPIDNPLQFPDECARHKILDCIGDFALLGTDLAGHIDACCTGHTMNHAATRLITQAASRSTNRAQAA